ncbi:MAG TPA: MATE family efflux transporter, partial [Clostridiales bacterium]|nr:MATE family efflux transporter [Clostridiales bacterium]
MEKTRFETDLTQGSVTRQLIRFALPFVISNLIQSLYAVADMIIVGNFAGSASMNGVTQGSQMTMLVTHAVVGLAVGGTVLIGQYLGAGRRDEMKTTISTLLTTLAALAVAITAAMLLLRRPLLTLIQVPDGEVYEQALRYFTTTTWGTFFIFGYNALSAIMRGMGDSKTPLKFVGIACVFNIGFDLLLVGPFGMKA